MLADDPTGAYAFADAWDATGGGDPALHCRALAEIALGDPHSGAELLEKAAAASQAPDASRAAVLGQAVQAWLMADDPARGYDAASNAPRTIAGRPRSADRPLDGGGHDGALHRRDRRPRPGADARSRAGWTRWCSAPPRGATESRLASAQEDVDRAMALDADNPEALLERGIQRKLAGDPAGAREDWERAKPLAPDTATGDLAEQNLALLEAGPASR